MSYLTLGLWHACFDGFHDKGHQYEVKFYGCKHVLLEEYDIIREELTKRKHMGVRYVFKKYFLQGGGGGRVDKIILIYSLVVNFMYLDSTVFIIFF